MANCYGKGRRLEILNEANELMLSVQAVIHILVLVPKFDHSIMVLRLHGEVKC